MKALLDKLGLGAINAGCVYRAGRLADRSQGRTVISYNPTTGEAIGSVVQATAATYDQVVTAAQQALLPGGCCRRPNGACWCDLGAALRKRGRAAG
ncbi:MAG: hypothetical protein R3E79_06305 [Caldilineaceae bacterium]